MLYEYGDTCGRDLLKKMAENEDETIMYLYEIIKTFYPYLLDRKSLTHSEINQYNSLVNSNVYDVKVRQAIRER